MADVSVMVGEERNDLPSSQKETSVDADETKMDDIKLSETNDSVITKENHTEEGCNLERTHEDGDVPKGDSDSRATSPTTGKNKPSDGLSKSPPAVEDVKEMTGHVETDKECETKDDGSVDVPEALHDEDERSSPVGTSSTDRPETSQNNDEPTISDVTTLSTSSSRVGDVCSSDEITPTVVVKQEDKCSVLSTESIRSGEQHESEVVGSIREAEPERMSDCAQSPNEFTVKTEKETEGEDLPISSSSPKPGPDGKGGTDDNSGVEEEEEEDGGGVCEVADGTDGGKVPNVAAEPTADDVRSATGDAVAKDDTSQEDLDGSEKESVPVAVVEKSGELLADETKAVSGHTDAVAVSRAEEESIGVDGERDSDGDKTADESEMPLLAILDVRTVVDEEKDKDETMEVDAEDGSENKVAADDDDGDRGAEGDSNATSSDAVLANVKSTKNNKQANEDADMKNYAADTMNELLGLFGYEKVDETVKDSIQLGNKEKSEEADLVTVKVEDGEAKDARQTDGGESVAKSDNKPQAVKTLGQGRQCFVCGKTRSCKYQVLMLGMNRFLCDNNCFKEFRMKQNITSAPTVKHVISENRPITRSLTHPKDFCNVCQKEIKNGMGLLPGIGENKPLCSEECMRNYQATQGLKRACAQCGGHIQSRSKCLTWEAMEFCNEECLGKYQSYLGSHCAFCNNAVQQTSLGKYCVRFGSDIKQFCSNTCLEEFKKGLKICSYCQKDISSGTEGFLAPVGDRGQFKEFCSQACMEKYETMGHPTATQPSIQQCSVCNKVTSVKVEVTFEGKVHRLCSEPCIAAFRYANKINTSICDTCHKFFDLDVSRQMSIQFEGSCKRFCTKACMNVFVLHHRKVVPCSWCKVKKYNFDMIERVDSNNHVQLFCSLNCLSLFRVSLNATSSRRIQCDYCHQMKPAQYHLTMSDASIRNFCSYPCVMHFQSQFTTVAPVVPPQPTVGATTAKSGTQSQSGVSSTQSGTPVISSVVSLAPGQSQAQATGTSKPITIKQQQSVGMPNLISAIAAKSIKTVQTQTLYPAVTQHVVVKQPAATMQKNKTILCKPTVQTKGVSCKPHPCHKLTQTDEVPAKQLFIPIPVPIYVPVPMHMYTTPVPVPLAFPLPIPVPIFIPTTKNSAQSIFKQIKEIQEKIPDNPFEADLILMAEMVAEEGSSKEKARKEGGVSVKSLAGNDATVATAAADAELADTTQENFEDVESQLRDSCQTSNSFGDEVLQMALRMASGMDEPVDLETALAASAESNSRDSLGMPDENGSFLSARDLRAQARSHKRTGGRGRGRGRKRARMEEQSITDSAPVVHQQPLLHPPPPYSYGVNAWKHWVLQKNMQLEKASQTNRKLKLFKTDILQLTADELNYSLCLFVKEVRKPNGEEYASDSIYYLCLGIQQYLFENGRIDNIFADAYYEKFTECLNDVLLRYEMTLSNDGIYLSRIEEEILWECKQLGAHSPHVLLNTLMYFNTKFFMLKTVDEHTSLSFSHILKHWKKGPGGGTSLAKGSSGGTPGRSALLRYYPPSQMKESSSRKRKEIIPSFEQVENLENPLRCPVKLYEFYLSKCPESIKNRTDIFYLYPERSCVPDSPVWYSTMSLGKETITKMLQRIKMVREVGETIMMP